MGNLTLDELKELALALNLMSAKRYEYKLDEGIDKYKTHNEKFLKMDRDLLQRVKTEIEKLKGNKECQ
jgi:hypothetical protein